MADTTEIQSRAEATAAAQAKSNPGQREGTAQRAIDLTSRESNRPASIYKYPGNLGNDEQPHSLNIFISQYVPGATKQQIIDGNNSANAALSEKIGAVPSARTGNEVTAENSERYAKSVEAGVSIASAAAGAYVAGKATEGLGKIGNLIGKFGGGAIGGGVGAKLAQNASTVQTAPALRIKDVIQLHIAQSPQAKYGATYENEAIGTLLGALGGEASIGAMLEEAASGTGTDVIVRTMAEAATIPKELGLGQADFGALSRATSKKVRNPYQEQIFKTMNFRNFAFQYKFAPRNSSEFATVMSIIDLLKFHMHPEKDPSGAFFVFPSVFDLEYRYKESRNTFVNKIATSVLTDMSVDYGSEGVFTTFRGTSGAPSEITVALQFREISLLTKDPSGSGQLTNGTGTGY